MSGRTRDKTSHPQVYLLFPQIPRRIHSTLLSVLAALTWSQAFNYYPSFNNALTCNSLDSTLRTALASFYVSDTEGIRLGDFECNGDFSPTIHWIFVLLPNVISNSLVHCLGHERAYRIRSFCSHSNGCMLRIGTPSPFVHPPIRIFLCSWLCLRLPARCVAVRAGRTGMVRYCNGKVVVRSANETQPRG